MKNTFLTIACTLIANVLVGQHAVSTTYGEVKKVKLPLHAYCYLNNLTVLTYTYTSDTLELFLQGEAYIEAPPTKKIIIHSKSKKVFTISPAPNSTLNILNYTDDDLTLISVQKGSVVLRYKRDMLTIGQGNAVKITEELQPLIRYPVHSDTTWINKGMDIEKLPGYIVINKIARHFNLHIKYACKPKADMFYMNVKLGKITPIKSLNTISMIQDFAYKIEANKVTISKCKKSYE